MIKRIPPVGIATMVLGQVACNSMQALLIPDVDYSPEVMPAYDAIVGDFMYNEQDENVLIVMNRWIQPLSCKSLTLSIILILFEAKGLKRLESMRAGIRKIVNITQILPGLH